MRLLYFAWVRQRIGKSEELLDKPPSVTNVSNLVEYLRQRGPNYEAAFRDPALLRVALNQQHTDFNAVIHADDEVAFFPPVTGG